jgi:hypothetical protein
MLAMALALTLAIAACDQALEPRRDALRDLRNAAAGDTGTVFGKVYLAAVDWPETVSVYQSPRTPLPGAVVELGLWTGAEGTFRDTVRGGPPTNFTDERFEVVARVTTDESGAFRFAGLPKKTSFALRVRPPTGHGARPAYFGTLFWLYTSGGMDVSTVLRREPGVRPGT